MWRFALGLTLWTALLLWAWVQVGHSLTAPVGTEDEPRAPDTADEEPAGSAP